MITIRKVVPKEDTKLMKKSLNIGPIDLVNKPKLRTIVPDGYVPCPRSKMVLFHQPFVNWGRMIYKQKTVNTPKKGGAGFEDIRQRLVDQANQILISKAS